MPWLVLSADRCASCAPLVAAPRSLRQRCAPLVGSGSTQRCQQAMLLQFQAHGCSVDRFAGAEALHRVGQSQICTHVRCAERHLRTQPSSAAISCARVRRRRYLEGGERPRRRVVRPARMTGQPSSAAYHESTPRTPLRGLYTHHTPLRDPQDTSRAISPS